MVRSIEGDTQEFVVEQRDIVALGNSANKRLRDAGSLASRGYCEIPEIQIGVAGRMRVLSGRIDQLGLSNAETYPLELDMFDISLIKESRRYEDRREKHRALLDHLGPLQKVVRPWLNP